MKELDYIRVVLVQPTHPGNIGATARAMANMGVNNLALVQPRDFPAAEATARAAGADHILDNAVVVDDLDQAIADCALVIGASARPRAIEWPQLSPARAMEKAAHTATARHAHAALLFGRESRGLTNRELDRCHYLVRIPADPAFPSLNIASAAMVLLYELRKRDGKNARRRSWQRIRKRAPRIIRTIRTARHRRRNAALLPAPATPPDSPAIRRRQLRQTPPQTNPPVQPRPPLRPGSSHAAGDF